MFSGSVDPFRDNLDRVTGPLIELISPETAAPDDAEDDAGFSSFASSSDEKLTARLVAVLVEDDDTSDPDAAVLVLSFLKMLHWKELLSSL